MKDRNLKHRDDWETPQWLYDKLNKEFSFDFDPCPISPTFDGLYVAWGKSNFVNPPYSRRLKEAFIKRAVYEQMRGRSSVLLLPVSTSTAIFHEWILPNATEIRFLRGRVKFAGFNTKGEYVTNKPPMHDSMVVVFKGKQ